MKAVVTLSKKFFPAHYRAGQETEFKAKVLAETKKHTCRSNYEYWAKKIAKVKETGGVLSVRQWSEKPYRSPQEVITEVPADVVSIQKLELRRDKVMVEHHVEGERSPIATAWNYDYTAQVDGRPVPLLALAENDGLNVEEFKAWFKPVFDEAERNYNLLYQEVGTTIDFAVIHFTNKTY